MKLLLGDCLEQMRTLPARSVAAVVTDPPYGWRFMGAAWDNPDIMKMGRQGKRPGETYVGQDGKTRKTRNQNAEAAGKYDLSLSANQAFQKFSEDWAKEAFRVLKPGGHLLCFCGPRTYHRMASGVEDAGFEIRDQLQWIFGSGFPKSHDISKGLDKRAAAAAAGWGTALKPANEPIVLARRPFEGTNAQNARKWKNSGGLNIDASRIGTQDNLNGGTYSKHAKSLARESQVPGNGINREFVQPQGRWPANVLFDEEAAAVLDEQGGASNSSRKTMGQYDSRSDFGGGQINIRHHDSGGASRFFYCAKTSKSERNAGLHEFDCATLPTCQSEENTELATSILRVISALIPNSSIVSSGENITAIFPKECSSITKIMIRQITELRTWNLLMLSHTSDSMKDVVLKATDGTSRVRSVESLSELTIAIGILLAKVGSATADAKLATLEKLSRLSAESAWKPYNSNHPTVKPLKLMEYLIRLITPPGGTVLDPFMGSGSTGVAALGLGFDFIGIERDKEYFQIARKRIEACKNKPENSFYGEA